MSGHSKWSKVKHQKATTDVVKGAAFTKAAAAIIVAVREGGGITDPDKNFRLRLAVEKAHDVNMPKENIERAIERGAGSEGRTIESINYEAYGPGGVAIIIDAATDNRQRTVAEIKNTLDRHGGVLAAPGAVDFLFRRLGVIIIPKTPALGFDAILEKAINAGADDVVAQNDLFEIGSLLATPKDTKVIKGQHIHKTLPTYLAKRVEEIEQRIDKLTKDLTPMKTFILPGGGVVGAQLHIARTICRRAERRIVEISKKEPIIDELITYINRLSDLLFTMARFVNMKEKKKETSWKKYNTT